MQEMQGSSVFCVVLQIETTPELPKPRKAGKQAETKPLTYKVLT